MTYQPLEAKSAVPVSTDEVNPARRKILQGAGLAAAGSLLGLATGGAWAAGSDKP
jgi:nitrate/nitrite transport system substrate-binding protein